MKEKLTKLLEAKQEQKRNLDAALIESDSKEERAAIGETLKALATEIADVEAMLAEARRIGITYEEILDMVKKGFSK